MSVPALSQLHQGLRVNIVLKADQRTGRLTSGQIADFLTRGDHPRGVKVRLADGQIGRVQSVSPFLSHGNSTATMTESRPAGQSNTTPFAPQTSHNRQFKIQEDFRNDPTPADTRSLEDYIKKPTQKKKGRKNAKAEGSDLPATASSEVQEEQPMDKQHQLEKEFPTLDAALIAAMIADHLGDTDSAKKVLQDLAGG